MSTVKASFGAFQRAFCEGLVPVEDLTKFIVDEEVFVAGPIAQTSDGFEMACEGAQGAVITLRWKARGALFVTEAATHTSAPLVGVSTNEPEMCALLDSHAMIGTVRLQATFEDVELPQVCISSKLLEHSDGQLTRLVMESNSVFLYKENHSTNYVIPMIELANGRILRNITVMILESACPHIILPLAYAHHS